MSISAKCHLTLIASAIAIGLGSADAATIRITNDPGGWLPTYAERYSLIVKRRDTVIIDGRCDSACTLFLIYMPRNRVCVTPNARLRFHEASTSEGTRWLRRHYPRPLLQWIDRQGGLTATFIELSGSNLAQTKIARAC